MGQTGSKSFRLISVLFSIALLGAVAWSLDWKTLSETLARAELSCMAIALALFLATTMLQGARWYVLLKSDRGKWDFWRTQLINYTAFFHDLYAPGKLGSDAYRVIYYRKSKDTNHLVTSLLALRFQGLVTILFFAGSGALWLLTSFTGFIYALPLLFVLLIAILFLAGKKILAALEQSCPMQGWEESDNLIKRNIPKAMKAFDGMFRNKATYILSFSLNFIFLSLVMVIYYYSGKAFGMTLPLTIYPLTVPFLMMAAIVPVTVHGRGLTEIMAIYFWQGPDAGREQILLTCLMIYLLMVLQALSGGILWVLFRNAKWYRRGHVDPQGAES